MKYLAHPLIALALQALLFVVFGSWWLGVPFATGLYIMRETTQAEYRWIEVYGSGLRKNMPWWGAFDPRVWSEWKPWLDWLLPTAATCAMAWVMTA